MAPVVSRTSAISRLFHLVRAGLNAIFNRRRGALADFIKLKWQLGLNGGVVVANPVPEAPMRCPGKPKSR